MKATYTRTLKTLVATGLLVALVGCGTDKFGEDGEDGDAGKSPLAGQVDGKNPKVDGEGDNENGETGSDAADGETALGAIADGRYYLSSGSFEGSDAEGNKIDKQTLQIAGDYYWETSHRGAAQYEVTATGSAKLSMDNQVLAELNCAGSQDVYAFEVIASGSMRNFAQLEAGCPQESQLNASQQMSIRSLSPDTFEYTVVNQSEGVRIVETYIFRK